MKQIGYDMLYLTVCAVNGIKPDSERISEMDLNELFKICQFHSLTAIVCTALESAGISDKNFIEAKSKSIRKNILLDIEREKICNFMEHNGIWHMPLKGVILKEFYPKTGMRQMSDNDILYDRKYQYSVMQYMQKCGYTVESIGKSHHDTYIKPPVYNFEMHTSLFNKRHEFYRYYSGIKKRLVPDTGKEYTYHFTDEDFYVYMIAHEYKHYIDGGTGLRSLLDCFLYIKKKGRSLDWRYIFQQLKILGISGFEKKSRRLCMKIFRSTDFGKLSSDEKTLLDFYLLSGTYGTHEHQIKNRIVKMKIRNKTAYFVKRLFPDIEFWNTYFPATIKMPVMIPFFWCWRIVRGLVINRRKFIREFNTVMNTDRKEFMKQI